MTSILAIDTASERFAVALQGDGGTVRAMEGDVGREHSRQLVEAIRVIAGDELGSLTAILVTTGPGSYAGLRVGIATAEGLALARGIPVYGVGTLEAAAAAGPAEGRWSIVHPIGRGDFAVQEWEDGEAQGELRVVAASDLTAERTRGEGAGSAGGTELGPKDRVLAALRLRHGAIQDGTASAGAEAFYIREPHITRPKRATMAPGT